MYLIQQDFLLMGIVTLTMEQNRQPALILAWKWTLMVDVFSQVGFTAVFS